MKKKIIIALIIIIIIILFVPIPNHIKDEETIEYKALTYKISNIHNHSETYCADGIIIEIFGKEIFNNVVAELIERDRPFSYEKLADMALKYFFRTAPAESLAENVSKDEYHVGIGTNVAEEYQGQDMVVIEIRHINNNINNALDARYYINIFTAKGFDDSKNEIDLQDTANICTVTEVKLGESAWIDSLTKIKIKNTDVYFEITKKVKWEVPEHGKGETVSFSVPVPYTFVVDGISYSGVYELNESAWSKEPEGLGYKLRVVNLTKEGKIEVEITKND